MSDDNTTTPPLLTIQEVADYLSLHPTTVWKLCKSGNMPGAFKIGGNGRWRIKKDLLESNIKNQLKQRLS